MRRILKQENKSWASFCSTVCYNFSLLGLWPGSAKELQPLQFLRRVLMVSSLPYSIQVSRHNKSGQLPWATLLMQSRYCAPFSSNMYCRWARTILMGSAAKKTLHEGLEIMKGNTPVCQCFSFSMKVMISGKLQLYKGKGKHNLGDITLFHIGLEPLTLILHLWHCSHFWCLLY